MDKTQSHEKGLFDGENPARLARVFLAGSASTQSRWLAIMFPERNRPAAGSKYTAKQAGREAVQSIGDARGRSPVVHPFDKLRTARGRRSN